jgi:hypothetical protein
LERKSVSFNLVQIGLKKPLLSVPLLMKTTNPAEQVYAGKRCNCLMDSLAGVEEHDLQ